MSNPDFKSEKICADECLIFNEIGRGRKIYHFNLGQRSRCFEKIETVVAVTGERVWNIVERQKRNDAT